MRVSRRATILTLVFGFALAMPLARQQETPPAENPLPQEAPVVEDPNAPPPPPPPPAPPAPVTLGEMAVRAATDLKLPAPPTGLTPESAAWALVLKGIKLRPELGSPLTEADVVGMLTGLGFKVRSSTPSRVVSRDRFEILAETFLSGAAAPAAAPPPAPVPPPAPPEGRN